MLAGISVEYYTRLERGNTHGVSDDVLEGIARALQLDEAERAHLFDLVRAATTTHAPRRRPTQERVRPSVQQILDSITAPAYVRNERLDILAANRLGEALYSPVFDFPSRPVNIARFLFLDPTGIGVLRRLGHHRPRRRRHPARRSRTRPLRQAPHRPHRRAVHPQRRVPRPLGRAQRQVPPHRHQTLPPPDRRRPHPQLRSARARRRPRTTDQRLHRRTRLAVTRRARPARLVDHHTGRTPGESERRRLRRQPPRERLTPVGSRQNDQPPQPTSAATSHQQTRRPLSQSCPANFSRKAAETS